MTFASSPAFDIWLLIERRRLAGASDDILREVTLDFRGEDAHTAA